MSCWNFFAAKESDSSARVADNAVAILDYSRAPQTNRLDGVSGPQGPKPARMGLKPSISGNLPTAGCRALTHPQLENETARDILVVPLFMAILGAFVMALVLAGGQHGKKQVEAAVSGPLPDAKQLVERAMASEKATYERRENYLCELHAQRDELDPRGNVKKHHSEDLEEFFVNGHQIDHLLAKNGQALKSEDARKEDERVDKQVKKYSDASQRQKEDSDEEKRVESVLRMMKFESERRIMVNGRATIEFDITGNMEAKPNDLTDRFVQAMQGTLELDEATGQIVDLNIHSTKDVKVAGGLLASLHKGFWLHLHQVLYPDGVWLPNLAEGSGDARAAIFLHPYFRFHQTEGDCRLYGVSTTNVIKTPTTK